MGIIMTAQGQYQISYVNGHGHSYLRNLVIPLLETLNYVNAKYITVRNLTLSDLYRHRQQGEISFLLF